MKGLRLYKIEKLCSETAIGNLFGRGHDGVRSSLAYPLRIVWTLNRSRAAQCPQFLVSVPKKRIRLAVDRVTMRRRVREAYRLNRHLIPRGLPVDMAFIYVAPSIVPSGRVHASVRRLLGLVATALEEQSKDNF